MKSKLLETSSYKLMGELLKRPEFQHMVLEPRMENGEPVIRIKMDSQAGERVIDCFLQDISSEKVERSLITVYYGKIVATVKSFLEESNIQYDERILTEVPEPSSKRVKYPSFFVDFWDGGTSPPAAALRGKTPSEHNQDNGSKQFYSAGQPDPLARERRHMLRLSGPPNTGNKY